MTEDQCMSIVRTEPVETAEDRLSDSAARAVTAEIAFAERTVEKPYSYVGTPPEGVPQTRGEYRPHEVRIENARPIAERLSLDVEGIAVVRRRSAVRDFWDEAQTLALGHPETAQLVKDVTGAKRVVVYDHTLRRRSEGTPDRAAGVPRQPVNGAHVDQTVWSGPKRVREIMGDEAEALLAGRAAIINVWRPIAYAARDWPLAVADARSVAPEDLIGSDLIFPHRRGETYRVAFNPAQRWLYVPDLQPEEAILIKCWDSDPDVARFAPHTGFEDPTTPPERRRARASNSAPSPSSTEGRHYRRDGMIEVHYWPTPNGKKVTILLEELGAPYRIVPVHIGRGDQFTDQFLAISPNNRMPAIVDTEPKGGGASLSVFESAPSSSISPRRRAASGRRTTSAPNMRWHSGWSGRWPTRGRNSASAAISPACLGAKATRAMPGAASTTRSTGSMG